MQALKRINIDICVRDANNIAAQMWEYVSRKKNLISGRKVFVQFAVGEAGTDANCWAIGIMKIGAKKKPRVWDIMIELSDGSLSEGDKATNELSDKKAAYIMERIACDDLDVVWLTEVWGNRRSHTQEAGREVYGGRL